MSKLFALKGKIQNYPWGGTQYISELLSIKNNTSKCAEYWLGTHIKAPSTIITSKGETTLNTYLESNLLECLGANIVQKFGRLPFLFKVLDVHNTLSIQVHPTKIEAEKGFKHENEQRIPLNAAHRNYKDDNHKPEIVVALSEFWLLHGFLPKKQLSERLKQTPEFHGLITAFNNQGYYGLYKKVMQQSAQECYQMLAPLINRIMTLYLSGKLDKSSPNYWAAKAVNSTKNHFDKGIYSIYFFNIVKLNKGESVFQDAGIPHAYLQGQSIELMANSDNILRGGLTTKHIDIPQLLKHIIFKETIPNIMLGDLQQNGIERIYNTAAPDFELSKIEVSKSDNYQSKAKTAQILILIQGKATIEEGGEILSLSKGECAFLKSGSNYSISSSFSAILYKATTP